MDIFGIRISSADLWLFGIAGTAVAWLIQHWFSTWRDRHNRFVAASITFRAAFNDALLRLTASREATSTIVFQNHNNHLAAIIAFNPYVPWYSKRSFDCAAKEYSLQANIQNHKGPIEALVFDVTPEAQQQRAALLASVQRLLKHASAT